MSPATCRPRRGPWTWTSASRPASPSPWSSDRRTWHAGGVQRRFPTLARWALIFGAWTLVGLLVFGATLARRATGHGPPPTAGEMLAVLESMWLWALFTPPM